MPINDEVALQLGNRVRVRACGLLYDGDALLMINHTGLYGHDFWSPPGGGLAYGETPQEALVREFREECGLIIEPGDFRFTCSVRKPPLHAIELFFTVRMTGGRLQTGQDPERGDRQIISAVEFLRPELLDRLPSAHKHPILSQLNGSVEILRITGFFDLT
ncbi:MAG: NUDIX domain-containing protein [Bacteroidota bacterium]